MRRCDPAYRRIAEGPFWGCEAKQGEARRDSGDLLLVSGKSHFLLFTLYDKDQKDDLTKAQRDTLREMLEQAKKRGR